MQIISSSERKRIEIGERLKVTPKDSDSIALKNDKTERILKGTAIFLLGIFIVILIWSAVAWYYNSFQRHTLAFPEPLETFGQLWSYIAGENMLRSSVFAHIIASMERWIIGFVIAAVIGIFIGMALGSSDRVYSTGMVPVNILQMIPGLAWIPVAFLLFGLGNNTAIFIIAVSAISPVAMNVAAGIRRVPRVNIRTAKMVGLSKRQMFDRVLLPYATVDIVTGLRVGMANAWRMLIAAEMVVGVAIGLGYTISQSVYMLDYVTSFVCIIIICIIGLFIDKVVFARIEKYAKERLGTEGSQ
ncbi:MAG: ABC transporter permease [Methanomassiliicoccaceae archaeon]|jgi:ABC-type nitrate/sulfonate/bicarbonate transport system permease component|nr:ABC transporter permease [Methanomassiliicoccaceae archaeon]